MPRITDYYGIVGPVPFADIHTDNDNQLYLDPRAIRLAPAPRGQAAHAEQCLDTFAFEVLDSVLAASSTGRRRGKHLLQQFTEPWETRLGMSRSGFHGHGGACVIGDRIWDTLANDLEALIRFGLLAQIEDLPLFIKGVDKDITSDTTTRIVYSELARFTAEMLDQFPEFTTEGHQTATVQKQVWSPTAREWALTEMQLPIVNGKELLLVPAGWTRSTLLMSARRFYETSVLSFVQSEQEAAGLDGGLLLTPKKQLKRRPGLAFSRNTNITVTLRAYENDSDLIGVFKSFVSSRWRGPLML